MRMPAPIAMGRETMRAMSAAASALKRRSGPNDNVSVAVVVVSGAVRIAPTAVSAPTITHTKVERFLIRIPKSCAPPGLVDDDLFATPYFVGPKNTEAQQTRA